MPNTDRESIIEDRDSSIMVRSSWWSSQRFALWSVLIVLTCLLVSYPVAELAWGDDFSYIKSALDFAHTGRIVYNGWASAMLGWQIMWGALWIKLFGFSFLIMRVSMIPLALACVYLFERILENFGISPRDALFGSLTLGVSPLFLPLAETFMTDVPGLLSILICVWMCQRGALARRDLHAVAWLVAAALTNAALGTVRQIVWLGALVMVPSAAWMLRRRRGIVVSVVSVWFVSVLAILASVQWFLKQPYSLPEHVVEKGMGMSNLLHLVAQVGKAILCQLSLLLPLTVAWFAGFRKLSRRTVMIGAACAAAMCAALLAITVGGDASWWLTPWLLPVLSIGERFIPVPVRAVFSAVTGISGIVLVMWAAGRRSSSSEDAVVGKLGLREMGWILGPFTVCYVLLLLPRAAILLIQDRYLLCLMPSCIAFLLLWHRRSFGRDLPAASAAVLLFYGVLAVGWNHDSFAESRATEGGIAHMEALGVPATELQSGLGPDGWTQVQHGHINFNRIVIPAGAYDPNVPTYGLSERCNYWIAAFTPAIIPRYFVSSAHRDCPTSKVVWELPFRAWMPPFRRSITVQALPGTYE